MGFFKSTLCEKLMGCAITSAEIFKLYLAGKNRDEINSVEKGNTPLFWGILQYLNGFYDIDIVETLLQCGANPNQPILMKEEAYTPLMYSSLTEIWNKDYAKTDYSPDKFLNVVKLLVSYGANVNQLSNKGNSALIIASRSWLWNVAAILESYGADPTVKQNCKGKRPFEILLEITDTLYNPSKREDYEFLKKFKQSSYYLYVKEYDDWVKKRGYCQVFQKNSGWKEIDNGIIRDEIIIYADKNNKRDYLSGNIVISKSDGSLNIPCDKDTREMLEKYIGGEKYYIFINFLLKGYTDREGSCYIILHDIEAKENSKLLEFNYTVKNEELAIMPKDRFQSEKFIEFLQEHDDVYVHFCYFDEEIPARTLDFYLNDVSTIKKYLKVKTNQ